MGSGPDRPAGGGPDLFTRALTGDRSPSPWPERAVDTVLTGLRLPGKQMVPPERRIGRQVG